MIDEHLHVIAIAFVLIALLCPLQAQTPRPDARTDAAASRYKPDFVIPKSDAPGRLPGRRSGGRARRTGSGRRTR